MTDLLREALAIYGLTERDAVFLRHNENLTYRIGELYLLRIHHPAPGVYAPSTIQDREGELAFLIHLHRQGVMVQQPILNLQGHRHSLRPEPFQHSADTQWVCPHRLFPRWHGHPHERLWHADGGDQPFLRPQGYP